MKDCGCKQNDPKQKALRTMAYYMAIPALIGVGMGMLLAVLSDGFDLKTLRDSGENLQLIAAVMVLAAILYVFIRVLPKLMFFLFRAEPGLKDAVKAIWTDDDGKEIPSVPYIPMYKREFPNRITPSAVAALASCSAPVLLALVAILLVTSPLDLEYPSEPGTEQLVFWLLLVASLVPIALAYYAMAWMMRRYHAKELTAMLYYEDNSRELEHSHKDLQNDKEESQ